MSSVTFVWMHQFCLLTSMNLNEVQRTPPPLVPLPPLFVFFIYIFFLQRSACNSSRVTIRGGGGGAPNPIWYHHICTVPRGFVNLPVSVKKYSFQSGWEWGLIELGNQWRKEITEIDCCNLDSRPLADVRTVFMYFSYFYFFSYV